MNMNSGNFGSSGASVSRLSILNVLYLEVSIHDMSNKVLYRGAKTRIYRLNGSFSCKKESSCRVNLFFITSCLYKAHSARFNFQQNDISVLVEYSLMF